MAPETAAAGFLGSHAPERSLVAGCALLLLGDVDRADRLSQTVLARQAARPVQPSPLLGALREVVRPPSGSFDPPWVPGARVELRDAGPPSVRDPLLTQLASLPEEPRAAVVLALYAGLPPADVAAVLGTDEQTAASLVEEGRAALVASRPERHQPGRLAEELRTAAGRAAVSGSPATDLAHGRQLLRRDRLRRAAVVVAAAVVLVLGTVSLLDRWTGTPQAASTPVVPAPTTSASAPGGPAPVTAACDVRNPSCQATVMRRWRTEMSQVVVSHLDPEEAYFTGYSFSYDPRYDSPAFWRGGDGALGLEVFRLRGGATEVYVQVASGYDVAVRCGVTTGGRCEGQRFMNGNRFTLSTSTQIERGIEVQHRPDGDQVITVVARNTTRGRVLGVTRADLIELVQDPRLRLPVI